MTRSNLHITLSNGQQIICVADSTSAPEQGYIVEEVFTPLLNFSNHIKEMDFLKKHCTMDERRVNAMYRYYINLITNEIRMYEENYNYRADRFYKSEDLTERYTSYVESLNNEDSEESN